VSPEKGPGEPPIRVAQEVELGVNIRTAKPLGLASPPSMLARADEIIP